MQRPSQYFSSGSNNEIRLHKLGQIRWLYVESLPSSVWPILNQYIENEDNLSVRISDPDEGIIETDIFNRKNTEVKYRFKVEHGIRQASTELFFSELVKQDDNWAILDNDNSGADEFLMIALGGEKANVEQEVLDEQTIITVVEDWFAELSSLAPAQTD